MGSDGTELLLILAGDEDEAALVFLTNFSGFFDPSDFFLEPCVFFSNGFLGSGFLTGG
jgi:hypothetical protein